MEDISVNKSLTKLADPIRFHVNNSLILLLIKIRFCTFITLMMNYNFTKKKNSSSQKFEC